MLHKLVHRSQVQDQSSSTYSTRALLKFAWHYHIVSTAVSGICDIGQDGKMVRRISRSLTLWTALFTASAIIGGTSNLSHGFMGALFRFLFNNLIQSASSR